MPHTHATQQGQSAFNRKPRFRFAECAGILAALIEPMIQQIIKSNGEKLLLGFGGFELR